MGMAKAKMRYTKATLRMSLTKTERLALCSLMRSNAKLRHSRGDSTKTMPGSSQCQPAIKNAKGGGCGLKRKVRF